MELLTTFDDRVQMENLVEVFASRTLYTVAVSHHPVFVLVYLGARDLLP
jgi:hypothetical protein